MTTQGRALGQGRELVGHRFWDQQFRREQPEAAHDEKRPIHERRRVDQVRPLGKVLVQGDQASRDPEGVSELTTLGHAETQPERAERPRHCRRDEVIEILADEHEKRDAYDHADEEADAPEEYPRE